MKKKSNLSILVTYQQVTKILKESIRVWRFGWETDVISESTYHMNNSEVPTIYLLGPYAISLTSPWAEL